MNEETIENYKVINAFVSKYFSLTEDSKKEFERLLFNPEDCPEFALIASQPDRRLFIEDPCMGDEDSKEDMVWLKFASSFTSVVTEKNIKYSDFIEGKKDGVKISTVFFESFYTDSKSFFQIMLHLSTNCPSIFKKFILFYFDKNNDFISANGVEKISFDEEKFCIKSGKKTFKKKFNSIEVKNLLNKHLKEGIAEYINKDFFGVKKSKSKTICFSLNFADWLLASTGEEWSSCISLESSNGFWQGLPGLVGDKNRILVFTTNKEEKIFKGIKSFKMKSRAWGALFRNVLTKEVSIHGNKIYPQKKEKFGFKKYNEIFPNVSFREVRVGMPSAYEFPTLFHNSKNSKKIFSSCIFEDYQRKVVNPVSLKSHYCFDNDNGLFYYVIDESGVFIYNDDDDDDIYYRSYSIEEVIKTMK